MHTRRTFLTHSIAGATLGSFALPGWASAAQPQGQGRSVVYASLDREIVHYELDVANARLTERSAISLPACVQYAWPHASRRFLYVVCSDIFVDAKTAQHHLVALRIDPRTGELSKHGASVQLANRPIHMSTDIPSRHVLIAFNVPSNVQVFRINDDFTLGGEVRQPGVTDTGIYAHQVRVTPDNQRVILVTRGNDATATKPEDPGALKIFDYRDGLLSNERSFAPHGGIGFGPRNLDFHPTQPWVYISLERQNQLFMFRSDAIDGGATFSKSTLAQPGNLRPMQLAGIIHMHPSGRFVYVTNRAAGVTDFNGEQVSAGGENHVSVFAIDPRSGEPTLIQRADQGKIYPRTVDIDPSGRVAVVQNTVPIKVREGNRVRMVPAGLTLSRIGNDGRLSLVRTYDNMVYTRDNALWMGVIGLPG